MPLRPRLRLVYAAVLGSALLLAIFAALLIRFRAELGAEIRRKLIERDASVLHPFALQQLAEAPAGANEALSGVLRTAQQPGMLAVSVFDDDGMPVRAVPGSFPLSDLPIEDFFALNRLQPISRYHPAFPLETLFSGTGEGLGVAPVLEVLLPLYRTKGGLLAGVVRYHIDARPLATELARIDAQINRQTAYTLLLAATLIGLVVGSATLLLARAQRTITERNERLTRANFELTLAVKASALGQITSHLLHGLQGPVAGLRAAMAGHAGDPAPDWRSASDYTERLQALVHDTVALLGDARTRTAYELTGDELGTTIRDRHAAEARTREVSLEVRADFTGTLDSHRGSLLCLIAANLVQNALAATPAGGRVAVGLAQAGGVLTLTVADEGGGMPPEVRAHLFEPGRSGRAGGTGLGLAISRLLARQIGAELTLASTGADGTVFRLALPL